MVSKKLDNELRDDNTQLKNEFASKVRNFISCLGGHIVRAIRV